jgi:hypothetical protein
MANEVGRGFNNAGCVAYCSLFGQFVNLVIFNDVCAGSNFANVVIVVGGF